MKRCKSSWELPFYCAECQRTHGATVTRWQQMNGDVLCGRADNKRRERRMHNQRAA